MSGNNKSGYELRTDLLGMAIGIVESRIARLDTNEYLKPEGMRNAVTPYTTEDILVEAEKLYHFVQNSGQ
tara:strand:- start:3827 stop:4036 length:210 start_codon:yes stop_codon:yes gene_type:complete